MLNILFCVFLISAFLNGFILGGSIFWSLLTAFLSLALLAFRLLFIKKFPAILVRSASVIAILLLIIIGFLSGMKPVKLGYLSYDYSINEVNSLITKGDYFKASKELDSLEKGFGTNDRTQLFKAQAALGKKDFPAFEACLNAVVNKQSDQYFALLAKYYTIKEDYTNAEATLITAAKAYPLWSEAQLLAGSQGVNNKDYSKGEYFLLRAAEQVPADPTPLYYLGVIRYEQGNFPEAEQYFTESLQLGLNNEYASYIAWYRQHMGGGKQ